MGFDFAVFALVTQASLVVQLVLVVLLGASVLSWVLIVVKARILGAARRSADRFEARFWSADTQLSSLYQGLRKRPLAGCGLERIFVAGFREYARLAQAGGQAGVALPQIANRAMLVAAHRESEILDRYLFVLATIASTSPFVGLFGTVWGIMNAFRALGEVQTATLAMVATGIAEALIATAMGLVAAIPAAIAYNRYVDDLERLSLRFEDFAEQFTNLLQTQFVRARQTAALTEE